MARQLNIGILHANLYFNTTYSEYLIMADYINYMHNKTDARLKVQKRDPKGSFKTLKEIPSGKKDGPFDTHPVTELRFVVQSPRPVYFRFVEGIHRGDKNHIDGETGHPEGIGDS